MRYLVWWLMVFLGVFANSRAEEEWTRTDESFDRDRPDRSLVLRFRLNFDSSILKEALQRVSDPESQSYREYLTNDQIKRLVKPEFDVQEAKKAISLLFPNARIFSSLHEEYILAEEISPSDISRVFSGTEMFLYRHSTLKNRTIIRSSESLSVPSSLSRFVTKISGVHEKLPIPQSIKQERTLGSDPGIKITPPVIWKQYNVTDSDVGGKTSTSQGVAAFEDAEFRPNDVSAFQKAFSIPDVKFQVIGPNNGGYFGEAGLDTQYISASGRGVPSWFLSHEQVHLSLSLITQQHAVYSSNLYPFTHSLTC
jgi:subtilase family serine protease